MRFQLFYITHYVFIFFYELKFRLQLIHYTFQNLKNFIRFISSKLNLKTFTIFVFEKDCLKTTA